VLTLDKHWPLIRPEDVQLELDNFEQGELATVNFVLLIEGEQAAGIRRVHEPQPTGAK
jgi:hypothetical protein